MLINNEDILFLKNFPGLKIDKNKQSLSGELSFIATFNKKNKKYKIFKNIPNIRDKNLIQDSYKIEIDLLSSKNIYREVKEMGGKLKKVAERKKMKFVDLHFYGASSGKDFENKVCLAGYLDEKEKISLKDFLGEFVIPFFYDQSFFARSKNNKWPRGQYSHGCLGILENYNHKFKKSNVFQKETSVSCINCLKELSRYKLDTRGFEGINYLIKKKKIRAHWNCIGCGYGMFNKRYHHRRPNLSNFNVCHHNALRGLRLLRSNIKEYNLNI